MVDDDARYNYLKQQARVFYRAHQCLLTGYICSNLKNESRSIVDTGIMTPLLNSILG
jgi:hypothetical protein